MPQTGDLEALIDEERAEREERRGVETRATTLLAGSVAIIGLVAAATRDIDYPEATGWLILIIFLLVVILLYALRAIWQLTNALRVQSVNVGERPQSDDPEGRLVFHEKKIQRIEEQNKQSLKALETAIRHFAIAVALVVTALFALITLDATGITGHGSATRVIVPTGPPGPVGHQGPQGPRGPRGTRGPRGRQGP